MENKDVLIEFGADSVIVELDGIRAEVRGEDDVLSIKRAVASQLLHAIAATPERRQMQERQRQFENENMTRADTARGFVAGGLGLGHDIAPYKPTAISGGGR